jgi:hypothetical protein
MILHHLKCLKNDENDERFRNSMNELVVTVHRSRMTGLTLGLAFAPLAYIPPASTSSTTGGTGGGGGGGGGSSKGKAAAPKPAVKAAPKRAPKTVRAPREKGEPKARSGASPRSLDQIRYDEQDYQDHDDTEDDSAAFEAYDDDDDAHYYRESGYAGAGVSSRSHDEHVENDLDEETYRGGGGGEDYGDSNERGRESPAAASSQAAPEEEESALDRLKNRGRKRKLTVASAVSPTAASVASDSFPDSLPEDASPMM